jgi:hypothetical protein
MVTSPPSKEKRTVTMRLPDLARLSLSPPDVADVGAVGDQCDPREQERGVCVVFVPMPFMYAEARNQMPGQVLSDDETALAIRIDPNSAKWTRESPYDTLHTSDQYRKFCTILGFVPPLQLAYQRDDGFWVVLTREDGSWATLVRKQIIKTHPSEARPQQFWTRFRYQVPSPTMRKLTVQVMSAMHAYNARHPPVWKKVDEERRGMAAALAAAKEDRAREAQAMANAAPDSSREAGASSSSLRDAYATPTPPATLEAEEPPLDKEAPPELPSMDEVLEDEFVKSLLEGASSRDVPEFVV